MHERRGFTFLEILIAMAILAAISFGLMPLMTRLAASDRQIRLRAESWRAVQNSLTALYLDDPRLWKESESRSRCRIDMQTEAARGGVSWNKLTLTPEGTERPLVALYLESGLRSRPSP